MVALGYFLGLGLIIFLVNVALIWPWVGVPLAVVVILACFANVARTLRREARERAQYED